MSQDYQFYNYDEGPGDAAVSAPNGNGANGHYSDQQSGYGAAGGGYGHDGGSVGNGSYGGGYDSAAAPGPAAQGYGGGSAQSAGPLQLVIDADPAVRNYLAELIRGNVQTAADVIEARAWFGNGPVVAILGPSCAQVDDLREVATWQMTAPEVASFLVTSELTTELLQSALRVGIKDVMPAPIDADGLNETIWRIGQTIPVTAAPAPPAPATGGGGGGGGDHGAGRVLTVFSTKGGSGKSVTATNMAVVLARESSRPVVLLDGHMQFGDVSVMLKLQPQHSAIDAIGRLDSLDASMVESLLTVHEPSGLYVLPAPLEPTFADRITGEQVAALVECLRQFAGHVVVDLPAIFNEVVLSVIEASDDIMLVAELDVPNIKNVKIGLGTLELLSIPKERLHLVLNRANSKVKLNVAEVERTLGVAAVARVPSDVVVPISVNKGSPVVLSSPKSAVAKAFENLALQFLHTGSIEAEAAHGLRRFFG